MENEYALYSGDTFIACGTLKEISVETGIAISTLRTFYSDYYKKMFPNGKTLIEIEDEKLSKQQCDRFAFMLKQKRIDNKLSRRALSEKLGYPESLINKWEKKLKKPNYYIVEYVATYFKLPVNVFIGEE